MTTTTTKKVTKKPDKKTLVIVESPSKAKTIGKYLGSRYRVVASVGHVRDLPKSKLGIDVEHDFEPNYINIRGKGDLIKELKKEAKKASKIYLATDPDREGEAISWHLAYILGIDLDQPCRIEFNEVTKAKVKEAIKNPRCINQTLVDAQQARRILDRLVGYQISPLLWRKVKKGLSAGRVQSAALKIICDREKEIQSFVPEEYWTITATFDKGKGFQGNLITKDGKKLEIKSKEENDAILAELEKNDYVVNKVVEKVRKRNAQPPFTTSSMQQDASAKLNFNPKKTMMVAQQLYEGVDLGGKLGTIGLITYLRTDSVRISQEARTASAEYITNQFGKDYLGNNFYSNKKKDIQDAHEAIRPSDVNIEPDAIKNRLTNDQYKLYNLIWKRFVASQMTPAQYNAVQADIANGAYGFRATGSKLRFDGYQKVYKASNEKDKNSLLPALKEEEVLDLKDIAGEQSFTQPPARFTEASLVKTLEELNIGRPSTYAPIVGTLTERKYVKREKKTLVPQELGFTVTELMEEYFKEIVDVNFTAEMEDRLDDVEAKGLEWKSIIRSFYGPFHKELEAADAAIEKIVIEDQPTGEICELCGRPMVLKSGRYGDFIACQGYPECKNTKPIIKKTGVKCPDCGNDIIEKRGRSGKIFYGCSGYPNCRKVYWYRPVNKVCPQCGELLVERNFKGGKKLVCANQECKYSEDLPKKEEHS